MPSAAALLELPTTWVVLSRNTFKIDITPGSGIGNHGGDNNFYGMNEVQFDGVPVDSDGDGLPDSWETANGLDPGDPADASSDPDNDNLTNLEEFGLRTDPQENDTDMDGLLDGVESNTGTWNDPNDTGNRSEKSRQR